MKIKVQSVQRRDISGTKNGRDWKMDDTIVGYDVADNGVDYNGTRRVAYRFGGASNFDTLPAAPFDADIELGTGFDMRGEPVQIIVKCVPVASHSAGSLNNK